MSFELVAHPSAIHQQWEPEPGGDVTLCSRQKRDCRTSGSLDSANLHVYTFRVYHQLRGGDFCSTNTGTTMPHDVVFIGDSWAAWPYGPESFRALRPSVCEIAQMATGGTTGGDWAGDMRVENDLVSVLVLIRSNHSSRLISFLFLTRICMNRLIGTLTMRGCPWVVTILSNPGVSGTLLKSPATLRMWPSDYKRLFRV